MTYSSLRNSCDRMNVDKTICNCVILSQLQEYKRVRTDGKLQKGSVDFSADEIDYQESLTNQSEKEMLS